MSGHIFVISAPSGTGKTTVIKKLLDKVSDFALSVSYTTRLPRPQEKDGIDYRFTDRATFDSMARGNKFVEWAEVHGECYGTPKEEMENRLGKGKDILLDIDTQGAAKVKQKYPEAVLIFLLPPSFEELQKRLSERGVNTEEDLKKRINNARDELSHRHEYDYQVTNENLDEAVDELMEIIDYYRGL